MGVAVELGGGPEIFVVVGNFDAVPATAAAIRAGSNSLILMCRLVRARGLLFGFGCAVSRTIPKKQE